MPTPQPHPFLLCTREQFPELQARAEREPWRAMRADALARAATGPASASAMDLHQYLGAVALAYILDEPHRATHRERVVTAIVNRLEKVVFDETQAHAGVVPPLGAAFVAILALDIVYPDLTPEAIAACEAVIEKQITKIARTGGWASGRYGTHGTWDIYRGIRREPDDRYFQDFTNQMTDDGFSTVSPAYAFARLGAGQDRPQKCAYADVLEFTGIDRRYYNNDRLKKFFRWLNSASVTPARQFHLFGDVSPHWSVPRSPLLWRVGRFDRQAAASAAWLLAGQKPPGHILSYILMTEPLPEPVVPRSQLFKDGGAVFRETPDSSDSLGGLLYNITERDEWHTHEEVNGLSLAAYGNRLLVNGGWLDDPTRPPFMNNTVALNGHRHAKRTGAGIVEGLLADGFDYACGDSGAALAAGTFFRSFILVHGRPGLPGYFLVCDEITAPPDMKTHVYWQTASTNEPTVVADRREYRSAVNHHARVPGVSLTTFFGTEPVQVTTAKLPSGLLDRDPQAGHHFRLEAVYATGPAPILTVLFPHTVQQPLPGALARIAGAGCHGARVGADDVLVSDGITAARRDEMQFVARLVVSRADGFYFARAGRTFRRSTVGFESAKPVSIFMDGTTGAATTPAASQVTVYHPHVTGVRLDKAALNPRETGAGWMRFDLPPGTHSIELLTER
ncbi:MAG: hypothetical protein PCFJNLEI_01476 [Verrucomicrobiae bacterium]|nr:hypothetical protein [Verrucomicrobiae bacterium]